MRRHSTTRRPVSTRRKLVWADTGGSVSPLGVAPAGLNFDLLAGYRAAGGSSQGITIMRTHITFGWAFTAANLVGGNEGFNIGLVIGDSTDTVATLNTTDSYFDWMLNKSIFAAQPGAVVSGSAAGLVGSTEIDVKAKRKCQELKQTLWLCLDARTASTALAVDFHARTLLALP